MTDNPLSEVARPLSDVPAGAIRDRLLSSINLMDNYNRGSVAEVIVAELLGAQIVGEGYGDWDLEFCGSRIEVKSSGDYQSWPQLKPSDISFSIARSEGYIQNPDGRHESDPEKKRRSDAYVFCHHQGLVPDDPSEWKFYVSATSEIDRTCGDQKTIALGQLTAKLRLAPVTGEGLHSAVESVL